MQIKHYACWAVLGILALVADYWAEEHRSKPFVPGMGRVPYAGRLYDAEEMKLLVDSALQFWLTSGPYTDRFERGLAQRLGVKRSLFVGSGSSANLLAITALRPY